MSLAVTLDDKYEQESGRVYLTGTQALVRLPMMQRQRDVETVGPGRLQHHPHRAPRLGEPPQQLPMPRGVVLEPRRLEPLLISPHRHIEHGLAHVDPGFRHLAHRPPPVLG